MEKAAQIVRRDVRDMGEAAMREISSVIEGRMKAIGVEEFDYYTVRDMGMRDNEVRDALWKLANALGVDVTKIGKATAAVLRRSPNLEALGRVGPGRCTRFAFKKESAPTPPAAAPEPPAVAAGDSLTLLEAAIRGAAEAVIVEVRKLMAGGPKS